MVSSSDSLLRTPMGSEIDEHDAVLRFNLAPTHPYEAFVGQYESLSVTNWPTWIEERYGAVGRGIVQKRQEFLVRNGRLHEGAVQVWIGDPLCASNNVSLCDERSQLIQSECQNLLDQAVHKCHQIASEFSPRWLSCHRLPQYEMDLAWHMANEGAPAFYRDTEHAAPGMTCLHRAPSTGLLGVVHAMQRCDKVRLFGFLQASNGSTYFDPGRNDEIQGNRWPFHDTSFEEGVYLHLARVLPDVFSVALAPGVSL